MLRRMVKSHARRLVPGWNLSDLLQALRRVSWTRSSASDTDPDSEMANARRFLISATRSSRKLFGGIALPGCLGKPFFLLESRQEFEELVRKGSIDEVVIMRFQRPPDRLKRFRVQGGVVPIAVLDRIRSCHIRPQSAGESFVCTQKI